MVVKDTTTQALEFYPSDLRDGLSYFAKLDGEIYLVGRHKGKIRVRKAVGEV